MNLNPREANLVEMRYRNYVWLVVAVAVPLLIGFIAIFVVVLANVPGAPWMINVIPKIAISLSGVGMLVWCYWHRTIVPALAVVVMIAGGASLALGLVLFLAY